MTEVPPLAFDDAHLFGEGARRSPDMEAVWSWIVEQDAGLPNWMDLPVAEARRQHNAQAMRWNAVLPPVYIVETLDVPGASPIPCQLVVPRHARPGCILFLHGGGWAFGNLDTHQRFMRLLAINTKMRVLGVDYRLAPEHRYPAPLDDCRAAWRWLSSDLMKARPELAGPLVVAGDSAGANLAMGIMLAAARDGTAMPNAAMLFYGAYDASGDGLSYRRFGEGFGLTRAAMMRFWHMYVPDPRLNEDILVSALHASDNLLRRLPPLYLNAAGLDPLLSDTVALAKRLELAGISHKFALHAGVHHGFMQMSLKLPEADKAIRHAARFLSQFEAQPQA